MRLRHAMIMGPGQSSVLDGKVNPMALEMYGIRNCDTVKTARAWLDERGIAYVFHDYKGCGRRRGHR